MTRNAPDIADDLRRRKHSIDDALNRLLPQPRGPARSVCEAMRYAVLGDGKRLRPILVVAACETCGGASETSLAPAAAIELIHAYSLIHDDLPSMDDDDLRRGRPTVHREFDEATAVLAGDALQALAFEILATHPPGRDMASRRCDASRVVAAAVGAGGMVGGQIADLDAEGRRIEPAHLRWIHEHKTAALFSAAAEIGAIHAGAPEQTRFALRRFGVALGLAFQITDDILDRTSSPDRLGKTPGKDARAGKATYPALFGMDGSQAAAREFADQARAQLASLSGAPPLLHALAEHAVARVR